jgi:mannose-6-phosphate isomerase
MEGIDRMALEALTRRPLLLPPNRVFRLWRGGAVLDRFQGRPHPEDGQMPEEWVGSTTVTRLPGRPPDEGLSHVELPGGRRLSLRALIEAFPEPMLGAAHVARFGHELCVLCKLLDSAVRNFIQAHPDRAFAGRHLASAFGKTEAWIVLATRVIGGEQPYILLGFKPDVTRAAFQAAARAQDTRALVDAMLQVPVRPGEVYLLRGGAPHALGPGVFLVEIQEPTDLVVNVEYRLFGRTEEQAFMGLPFERAMECFDYAAAGPEFVERHRLKPRPLAGQAGAREEILIADEDTPYFGAARFSVDGSAADRDRGRCYIGIVIEGSGVIEGDGAPIPIRAGATFFVPAASRHAGYRAIGDPLTVIKCFPPRP